MKTHQSFKFKLNFRIYDSNLDVQKRNLALYKSAIVSIFIFLVIFSPVFAYLFIIYNNVNLKIYFDYYSLVSQHMTLPSKINIFGTIWSGFGLTLLAIFLLGFFKPFITMDGMGKNKQLLFVIGIILVLVLALLLSALSQYFYSQYEDFFKYEALTNGNKKEWAVELSQKLSDNYNQKIDIFLWQGATTVWWFMFFQLTVVFALAVFLQNSVFSKNELLGIEQYINYSIQKQKVDRLKWTQKIVEIFKVTDRNLSIWLLVISSFVVVPNFVYSILISVHSTGINALINWTYNVPNLIQDYQGVDDSGNFNDLFAQVLKTKHVRSDFFLLNSLPIIVIGLTFSTTFFFISIMLRGGKNTQTIFLIQYLAMSLEILFLLSFFLYAKLEVEFLYLCWSTPAGVACFDQFKQLVGSDFQEIISLYSPADVIGQLNGKIEWWSGFEIITESIIGFSFAICSLFGVAVGMFRSNQIARDFLKEKSLINLLGEIADAN